MFYVEWNIWYWKTLSKFWCQIHTHFLTLESHSMHEFYLFFISINCTIAGVTFFWNLIIIFLIENEDFQSLFYAWLFWGLLNANAQFHFLNNLFIYWNQKKMCDYLINCSVRCAHKYIEKKFSWSANNNICSLISAIVCSQHLLIDLSISITLSFIWWSSSWMPCNKWDRLWKGSKIQIEIKRQRVWIK